MPKSSDADYRRAALDGDSIKALLHCPCGRRSPGDCSMQCTGACFSKLGGSEEAQIAILTNFRKNIWLENGNASSRRALLISLLFDASYPSGKTRVINYNLSGVSVCRNFFFKATAFEARFFHSCCDEVATAGDALKQEVLIGDEKDAEEILGKDLSLELMLEFLDDFFSPNSIQDNKGIDNDPAKSGVQTTRLSWAEIYREYYVPFCAKNLAPLSYDNFCRNRKKFRPRYQRDRKSSKRGWNHMCCHTCDKFKRKIERAKKKGHKAKKADLRAQYNAHLKEQDMYRKQYKHRALKGQLRSPYYCSAIVDATSSLASSYVPHVAKQSKSEPERHTLLKMKSTFARVHGVGTLIFQSFPELEKQGSNLILECCLESLHAYLKHNNVRYVDTFCIQLDNTSVNKAWTLIAGLSALTLAGIVRKIKLSYLLVGHTHEDVDAIIGKVLGGIRYEDMYTYPQYEAACAKTLMAMHCRIIKCGRMIGIPDYDKIFEDFNCSNVQGITETQQMRIESKPDGSGIKFHYRADCTQSGWFPSPYNTSPLLSSTWDFRHPDHPLRPPMRLTRIPLSGEPGKRQSWLYTAEYFGGLTTTHEVPCPSVHFNLCRHGLGDKLVALRRQPFKEDFFVKAPPVLRRILKLLRTRRRPREECEYWQKFFADFPASKDDSRYESVNSCLIRLLVEYTQDLQYRRIKNYEKSPKPNDFVDIVTFKGGNVTRAEMRSAVKFYGFKMRTRKQNNNNKKKKKKVSGEKDDNSCNSSESSVNSTTGSSSASLVSCRHSDTSISSVDSAKQLQRGPQKRKYNKYDSSQESCNSGNDSDNDSEEDPVVKQYGHLLGSFHEDKEDGALYQVTGVGTYDFEGKPYIVAYRKRYDGVNGTENAEEEDPPTLLQDVIKMTNAFQRKDRLKKRNRTT